jgi:hypothetical protein
MTLRGSEQPRRVAPAMAGRRPACPEIIELHRLLANGGSRDYAASGRAVLIPTPPRSGKGRCVVFVVAPEPLFRAAGTRHRRARRGLSRQQVATND